MNKYIEYIAEYTTKKSNGNWVRHYWPRLHIETTKEYLNNRVFSGKAIQTRIIKREIKETVIEYDANQQ